MMWRTAVFAQAYEKQGHALFVGKSGFYPVDKFSGVIIKRKEDLKLAEFILKSMANTSDDQIEYDPLVKDI
ncbi:MAG: hypothetical protein HUK40_15330 [Desulfobacter sp.]|nr:hypothetical protein [Desulfobacter sp.]WDP87245.1 MAG: hypothetical protein HUN05_20700 [Desulfobacter sp.]